MSIASDIQAIRAAQSQSLILLQSIQHDIDGIIEVLGSPDDEQLPELTQKLKESQDKLDAAVTANQP